MDIEDILGYISSLTNLPMEEVKTANIDELFPDKSWEASIKNLFECIDFYFVRELDREYSFQYEGSDGEPTIGETSCFYLVRKMDEKSLSEDFDPVIATESLKAKVFSFYSDDSSFAKPTADNSFSNRRVDKILEKVKKVYDELEKIGH